jgi:hypothetical protein
MEQAVAVNSSKRMHNFFVTCSECGKYVEAFKGNQKTCGAVECKKIRAKRLSYDGGRSSKIPGKFICPHCSTWHNQPRDFHGHKYQYCFDCRKGWGSSMPIGMDEYMSIPRRSHHGV